MTLPIALNEVDRNIGDQLKTTATDDHVSPTSTEPMNTNEYV